ncbi:tectonin beta-propeller repeat-containing protein 2-like isoform X2 [Ptychodera flava]|uniref:tectonin beta-propeller repeat-containing protein 2-like isoform X2 n=1 Tax=Ptychodera flava TaxID=63121 RepID=UPI00396A1DF7
MACGGENEAVPAITEDIAGEDLILKEFQPLSYLHNHLPQKAQRGIQNIDIQHTCIDVNKKFIVLGCNIGLVFLFDRRSRQLTKLRVESGNHSVTTVKLSSCLDDLLAAGTSNGSLCICQLPSNLPGHDAKLKRHDVERLHSCSILCAEWSTNGMKLYTGDERGRVIYTAVDFYESENPCKSAQILTEGSAIIQLSYAYKKLLVSTLQRSVLCHTDEDNKLDQVGQKSRKSPGPYGAFFIHDVCRPSDAMLYASRPGLRLWKANANGAVKKTYILKDIIKQCNYPLVDLLPDTTPADSKASNPVFGYVLLYRDKYVLTWCNNLLYIVDPELQVIMGAIQGSAGQICDVATSEDEIFVLRSDPVERPVIRIASKPEPKPYKDTERVSLENPTSAAESISNFRIPAAAEFTDYFKKPTTQDDSKFTSALNNVLSHNPFRIPKLRRSRSSEDLTEEEDKSSFFPNSKAFLKNLLTQRRNSGPKSEGHGGTEAEAIKLQEKTADTEQSDETVTADIEHSDETVTESRNVNDKSDVGVNVSDEKSETVSITVSEAVITTQSVQTSAQVQSKRSDEIVFAPKPKKKKKKNKKRDLSPLPREDNSKLKPDTISIASTTSSTSDPGADPPILDEVDFPGDEDATPTNSVGPEERQTECVANIGKLQDTGSGAVDGKTQAQAKTESPEVYVSEGNNAGNAAAVEMVSDSAAANDAATSDGRKGIAPHETMVITSNETTAMTSPHDIMGMTPHGSDEQSHDAGPDIVRDQAIGKDKIFKEYTSDSSGSDFGEVVHEVSGEFEGNIVDNLDSEEGASNADSASTQSTDNDAAESSVSDFYSLYQDESDESPTKATPTQQPLSPIEQSTEKVTMKYLQFKVSDSWVQCNVPHNVTFMTASDKHLWCVDNRDRVYHCLSTATGDIKWSKLKDSARQIAVSSMESIVWCVHRKSNSAYASTKSTPKTPIGSKWNKVATDVATVCVDNNQAWILKNNGELYHQHGLDRNHPFSHRSLRVAKNCHLAQLVTYKGVVWGLTHDHRVFYRYGISESQPGGTGWKLVDSEKDYLAFTCIALGPDTGWGIDDKGSVWFRPGVSAATPHGEDGTWWQVSMSDYLMQDSNVFVESVLNFAADIQKPMEYVTSLWKGSKPTLIAANSNAVWVSGGKNTLHMSRGNLLGHRWEMATPVGIADSARWECVSASAAASSRYGLVWALQPNGEVFCFPPNTRKPTPVIPPLNVMFKYISATPQAVWGLSHNGAVFIRAGMADHCRQGVSWKPLDLSQLGNVHIAHMSCGSEAVWICDTNGYIYFRMGVKPPAHASLNPAWLPVEGRPQGLGSYFTQIMVGPSDQMVWAVDNRKAVYVRKGISQRLPIGSDWDLVSGTPCLQLAISADMVWALCPNGDIACRYGISDRNPNGDYWKKIPGNFTFISASPNNHLWSIDKDGHIHQRITRTLMRTVSVLPSPTTVKTQPDIAEDWEFL